VCIREFLKQYAEMPSSRPQNAYTYYCIIRIEGKKYDIRKLVALCCIIILKIMITFQNERSVFEGFFH
jgi:hypothetical protein